MNIKNLKSFIIQLGKNKVYTVVTIFGLAVSLTFVVLLSFYLKGEYDVNQSIPKKDRIYRMTSEDEANFPPPVGQAFMDAIPDIESYTRAFTHEAVAINKDTKIMVEMLMVDSTFLDMFSFNMIKGDPVEALKLRNSVVLTQEYANKLFGDEDPIGKTINLNERKEAVVTGIIEDYWENSSFVKADALVNFCFLADLWEWDGLLTSYGNSSFGLYVLEKENANIQAKIPTLLQLLKERFWVYQQGRSTELHAEKLTDVYLSPINFDANRSNSKTLLVVLIAIVLSILTLAIINYINLTIALSSLRIKETAIKKLLGGSRRILIRQFINESFLVCMFSAILAFIIAIIVQPVFNTVFQSDITIISELNLEILAITLISIIAISFLAGFIPALIITKSNAIEIIKGAFQRKRGDYTKVFIGFQFVVVVIMLVASLSINKQTRYMRNYDMGFTKDNIVSYVNMTEPEKRDGLRNELLRIPGVKNVSFVAGCPIDGGNNWSFTHNEKPVSFQTFEVDSAFFTMMNMKVKETGAAQNQHGMWLNKKGVKALELEELPKSVTLYGDVIPILGVVEDFKFRSLHQEVGPLMIRQLGANGWPWNFLVQIEGSNISGIIKQINKVHSDFSGGLPAEFEFFDETIQSWYNREARTGKIVNYFTILTIIIAIMGIYAMSVFYLQQKVKEIGIRKVNGAKIGEVVAMVNIGLIKWVSIAYVIALPLSYIIMNKWLSNFAYKTAISWWIYTVAAFTTLLIALIALSSQSYRAAVQNPVKALRYE